MEKLFKIASKHNGYVNNYYFAIDGIAAITDEELYDTARDATVILKSGEMIGLYMSPHQVFDHMYKALKKEEKTTKNWLFLKDEKRTLYVNTEEIEATYQYEGCRTTDIILKSGKYCFTLLKVDELVKLMN